MRETLLRQVPSRDEFVTVRIANTPTRD